MNPASETQNNINKILGEVDEKTQNVVEKKRSIKSKDSTESRLKQAQTWRDNWKM